MEDLDYIREEVLSFADKPVRPIEPAPEPVEEPEESEDE